MPPETFLIMSHVASKILRVYFKKKAAAGVMRNVINCITPCRSITELLENSRRCRGMENISLSNCITRIINTE